MKGATFKVQYIYIYYLDISIHAPMKGATIIKEEKYKNEFNFNPRTHEGCDS